MQPFDLHANPAFKHLASGKQWMEIRRYKEAVDSFSKYIQALPEDPAGHYHLSRAYYALAKYDEAVIHGERSLALNPEIPETLHLIGLIYFKKGDWVKTEAFLQKSLEINPDNPEVWIHLATPYLYRKELDKLEVCVDKVLKINPHHAGGLNYKAQLFMQRGDFEKANEYISLALGKEPERGLHHTVAGQIKGLIGNHISSQGHFDVAMAYEPLNIDHRLRYLNTMFSGSFLGKTYHQTSVWGANKFKGYYLILMLYSIFFLPFYLMEFPKVFKFVGPMFFAPLFLLFGIYTSIPTAYKSYKNWRLWGKHGINMSEDLWNASGLLVGLLFLAAGLFLQNQLVSLVGSLILAFAGGLNWVRLMKNTWFKKALILILLTIPIVIAALLIWVLVINVNWQLLPQWAIFGLILVVGVLMNIIMWKEAKKEEEQQR